MTFRNMMHTELEYLEPHKPVHVTIVTDEDDAFTDFRTRDNTVEGARTKALPENTSYLNLPTLRQHLLDNSESNVSQQLPRTSRDMQRAPSNQNLNSHSYQMNSHIHPNINTNTMNEYNHANQGLNAINHSNPYIDPRTFNNNNVFNVNPNGMNGHNPLVHPSTINNNHYTNLNRNVVNNYIYQNFNTNTVNKTNSTAGNNTNLTLHNNVNKQLHPLDKISSHVLKYFEFLYSAPSTAKHRENCKRYQMEIFHICYHEVLIFLLPRVNYNFFNHYISKITTLAKNGHLPLDYYQIYDLVHFMITWTNNVSKSKPQPARPPPRARKNNKQKSECIFKSQLPGGEITITVDPNLYKTYNNIERFRGNEHNVHIQSSSASQSHQATLNPLTFTTVNTALNSTHLDNTRISIESNLNQIELQSTQNRKRTLSGDSGFTSPLNFDGVDDIMDCPGPPAKMTGYVELRSILSKNPVCYNNTHQNAASG